MASKYSKAIAAVGAAIVAVAALLGADVSEEVEVAAGIFVAATPLIVLLAPKNTEV